MLLHVNGSCQKKGYFSRSIEPLETCLWRPVHYRRSPSRPTIPRNTHPTETDNKDTKTSTSAVHLFKNFTPKLHASSSTATTKASNLLSVQILHSNMFWRIILGLPLKFLFLAILIQSYVSTSPFNQPICRVGYLSCETANHPEVCCPIGDVCGFDSVGTIACCQFQSECVGHVIPQNLTQFQIPAPGSLGVERRVDPMWWILGLIWGTWGAAHF